MKKVLAIAVVLGLAGGAQAASVGFDFGTNWVKWNNQASVGAANPVDNGRNFLLYWNLDNDISLGVYTEVDQDPAGVTNVDAIQIKKGVVKNVAVGLNIGSMAPVAGAVQPMIDVLGEVVLLGGTGDKVTGSLKAVVAARFSNVAVNADAVNAGLAVGLAF